MRNSFYLAVRFIVAHRCRTGLLITCIALTVFLVVVHHVLIARFEESLTSRAESTPPIVGARGSHLDLVLHALYLEAAPPDSTSMTEVERITESGFAEAIPIMSQFTASGFRIVGTIDAYWKLRQLVVDRGQGLQQLGDCVVGADVAEELDLTPGDRIVSDPLGGIVPDDSFPLSLRVTGILARQQSPDDRGVFTSLETTWLIAGLGHGHESANKVDPDSEVPQEDADHKLIRSGQIEQFTEVTEQNVNSFHFHGDRSNYPVTAVIAQAPDERSETLLLGRYLDRDDAQIVLPAESIDELLQLVLRVRKLIDVAAVIVAVVTVLFLTLTILLSLELRRREMETMFKLGCSRFMLLRLQVAELSIVAALSLALAGLLLAAIIPLGPTLLRALMAQSPDAGST